MRIWYQLQHPNILPFFGFSFFPTGSTHGNHATESVLSLVSPWMKNGTILEYIKAHHIEDRITLLSEVTQGLAYLHEQDVVHGDLKSSNILVNDDGHAVLVDFGLTRLLLDPTAVSVSFDSATNIRGTARYMAPELFLSDCDNPKPDKASDIWAFACVVLEVIGETIPYANCKSDPQVIYCIISQRLPYQSMVNGTRNHRTIPTDPDYSGHNKVRFESPGLWEICLQSWSLDPTARPSAFKISRILQSLANAKDNP
ncbi:kinase-like protein [Sistotremastrum niveocremeum HHB9708]|uniref:Kinase-like protein n=1 Tax=Sistotremastrum niveocremeum HHB9708 TaxID=1314777 RepID=A0A164PD61_9AGAM|nr:kinase-like protein [Sistotremastrum niveocremeum HHB9708]